MCYIALLKAAAIGVVGIGVGMKFRDKIKSGIRQSVRLIRETKNAYQEGEKSVDSRANAKQKDLPMKPDATDTSRVPSTSCRSDSYAEDLSRLKGDIAVLERENGELKRECESLRLKLEEAQGKVEVSFPRLVKRLYLLSESPEIKAILEENGLSLYADFSGFGDGFMRIRNESVAEATLVRPALVRGDDLIEPGIVHVPINEAGAEPPRSLRNQVESSEIVSAVSVAVDEDAKLVSETEHKENFHDDFVVSR